MVFNHALNQGNDPDILDIYSEVKLVDNGGGITAPANSRPISTLSAFTKNFFIKTSPYTPYLQLNRKIYKSRRISREERSMEQEVLEIIYNYTPTGR